MTEKNANRKGCVLVIIADGFDEKETVAFLSQLRQAGLCVKSVGLTSGLADSARGVRIEPDLTLTDLEDLIDSMLISLVILPEGAQNLARLENDPRVHRLLRQVVAQQGQVATGLEGLRIIRAAEVWSNGQEEAVLVRRPDQSYETFARYLVRRFK